MRLTVALALWITLTSAGKESRADGAFPRLETTVVAKTTLYRTNPAPMLKVRGWITYHSPVLGFGVLQDETGGLAFYPGAGGGLETGKAFGTYVEMTGTMVSVDGMWMLVGAQSDVGQPSAPQMEFPARPGRLPEPSESSLSALVGNASQYQRLSCSGTLRRVYPRRAGSKVNVVEVSSPDGFITARVPASIPIQTLRDALNSRVHLRGALLRRKFEGLHEEGALGSILVGRAADFEIRLPGSAFHQQILSVTDLTHFHQDHPGKHMVMLKGIITGNAGGNTLFMRVRDEVLELQSRQRPRPGIGAPVRVVGFPRGRGDRVLLSDAVMIPEGEKQVVEPRALQQMTGALHDLHGDRVLVEGEILAKSQGVKSARLLILMEDGRKALVDWIVDPAVLKGEEGLKAGSWLRAEGLCVSEGWGNHLPLGAEFTVRVVEAGALTVVHTASWWTEERLATVAASFLAGIVFLLLGLWLMRRRLLQQRQQLREMERTKAVQEERQRMARELHDNLQQHLTAAALQVESFGVANDTVIPSTKSMSEIGELLRECQVEARNCIWNLRSIDDDTTLVDAMGRWLQLRKATAPGVEMGFCSELGDLVLDPEHTFEVIRIAQEAVNNALRHGEATQIRITLSLEGEDEIEIQVEDNGRGFDPVNSEGPENGHFGLTILQERARRIDATVDIRSERSRGSRVRLRVPLRRALVKSS